MTKETKLRIVLVFVLALIAIAAAVVVLVIHVHVQDPIDLMIMYFAGVMLEIFCCVHIYRMLYGTSDVAVSK